MKKNKLMSWLLLALLPACTLTYTGCKVTEFFDDNPEFKEAAISLTKKGAEIAARLALSELGERVNELQPYLPDLEHHIDIAFTFAQPGDIAGAINGAIDEVPVQYQGEVRGAILDGMEQATHVPAAGETQDNVGGEVYQLLKKS